MIYSTKEVNMKVEKFKSLIKESIKEVLIEEGLLKEVITAVMKESQAQQIQPEQAAEILQNIKTLQESVVIEGSDRHTDTKEDHQEAISQINETRERAVQEMQKMREKMMDSIGKSSYSNLYNLEGVDLFEGTSPLNKGGVPSESPASQGPLSGVDPSDAGVSLDSFLGNAKLWKQLIEK
jgi:hypothetical protein